MLGLIGKIIIKSFSITSENYYFNPNYFILYKTCIGCAFDTFRSDYSHNSFERKILFA